MANNQNLRSFAALTPEQRREISRKGGQASGVARRKQRDLIEQELAKLCAEELRLYRQAQIIGAAARELDGGLRGARSRRKYIYRD